MGERLINIVTPHRYSHSHWHWHCISIGTVIDIDVRTFPTYCCNWRLLVGESLGASRRNDGDEAGMAWHGCGHGQEYCRGMALYPKAAR